MRIAGAGDKGDGLYRLAVLGVETHQAADTVGMALGLLVGDHLQDGAVLVEGEVVETAHAGR